MDEASRKGLAGVVDGTSIAELAARVVARSSEALRGRAACAGSGAGVEALSRLARAKGLPQGRR